jgi:hypothetical protein
MSLPDLVELARWDDGYALFRSVRMTPEMQAVKVPDPTGGSAVFLLCRNGSILWYFGCGQSQNRINSANFVGNEAPTIVDRAVLASAFFEVLGMDVPMNPTFALKMKRERFDARLIPVFLPEDELKRLLVREAREQTLKEKRIMDMYESEMQKPAIERGRLFEARKAYQNGFAAIIRRMGLGRLSWILDVHGAAMVDATIPGPGRISPFEHTKVDLDSFWLVLYVDMTPEPMWGVALFPKGRWSEHVDFRKERTVLSYGARGPVTALIQAGLLAGNRINDVEKWVDVVTAQAPPVHDVLNMDRTFYDLLEETPPFLSKLELFIPWAEQELGLT